MSETCVYELVDCTDEEMYFPLGVWLTFADAVDALMACAYPDDINTDGNHEDGYCKVEIREHRIGWGGQGKTIYTRAWAEQYDEVADEYVWKEVPNE